VQQTHSVSVTKTYHLMLYEEEMPFVLKSIRDMNTLCGQTVEFFNIIPGGT